MAESLIPCLEGSWCVRPFLFDRKRPNTEEASSVLSLTFSGLGWVVDDTGIFSLTRYVALPLINICRGAHGLSCFCPLGAILDYPVRPPIFLDSNILSAVHFAESDLEGIWESHGRTYKSRVWRGFPRTFFHRKRPNTEVFSLY